MKCTLLLFFDSTLISTSYSMYCAVVIFALVACSAMAVYSMCSLTKAGTLYLSSSIVFFSNAAVHCSFDAGTNGVSSFFLWTTFYCLCFEGEQTLVLELLDTAVYCFPYMRALYSVEYLTLTSSSLLSNYSFVIGCLSLEGTTIYCSFFCSSLPSYY